MAGALELIQEITLTDVNGTTSVSLGGSSWDTNYDVYMVSVSNAGVNTNGGHPYLRILDSSNAAVDSANYDWARTIFQSNAAIATGALQDQTFDYLTNHGMDNVAGETFNTIMWLYQFNNSSEYSYYSTQTTNIQASNSYFQAFRGGGVLTENAQHRGLHFYLSSGKWREGGNWKLYGLKK